MAVEQLEDRRLPSTVVPISLANGGPSVTPNGDSFGGPSADGRFVVFDSKATNIVSGQQDNNGTTDVFLYDRLTQSTSLVSHASGSTTTTANGASVLGDISADGRFIVYGSTATNLVAGQIDTNNSSHVFLYDRLTGTNTLVIGGAGDERISADGNFVVFSIQHTNLYLYERQTGSITLISHAFSSPTMPANGACNNSNINADGSRISFASSATDLISGQIGSGTNIFLYDRGTNTSTLVSHAFGSSFIAADADSFTNDFNLSANGEFVAYESGADNLVAGQIDTSHLQNIFVYDSLTGSNTLVSHSTLANNMTANGNTFLPVISSDGNTIVINSEASDLVTGFQNPNNDIRNVFVYDRITGEITLASHSAGSSSTAGNGDSVNGIFYISSDGNFLVYSSKSTDLVADQIDTNGDYDIFLYEKSTGINTLISHIPGSDTTTGNAGSFPGGISSDGRFVVFGGDASNLVVGDLNNHTDAFGVEPFDAPLTATGTFVSSASEQIAFTAIVAHFTDADSQPMPEDFKATVNWGDGTVQRAFIPIGNDNFSVHLGRTAYATWTRPQRFGGRLM